MALDQADFQVFELLDSGERNQVNVEPEKISEVMHIENVLLIVRLDLRRLFIWKGPKSPVRKRFISSREGSKLQEDLAKFGMHLKIISVDAGEEPTEFLQAFQIQSMEIGEADRMEDFRYIRNEERRKIEEAAIAEQTRKKEVKTEYRSPALEELKKKAPETGASKSILTPTRSDMESPSVRTTGKLTPISIPAPTSIISPQTKVSVKGLSESEEKAILAKVLAEQVTGDLKRLNVIIGTTLYGPQKIVKKVFGKDMESEEWGRITDLPPGKIDIPAGFLNAYINNNVIEAIEVLRGSSSKSADADADKKIGPKRELKQIPRGE
jgi:hypothetical protein